MIEDAGRERVPFTTGILVGIGETLRDRAESLIALRDANERHAVEGRGHVQEVIVQNFRAKPRTAMHDAPDASVLEYVAAVAVARLVLGPRMRVQVPPNLSDPAEFELLLRAGADDWGGVSPLTADHVNPERPWPHLDDLAARTAELGLRAARAAHRAPRVHPRCRDLDRPGTAIGRRRTGRARCRGWPLHSASHSADSQPLTAKPAGKPRLFEEFCTPQATGRLSRSAPRPIP